MPGGTVFVKVLFAVFAMASVLLISETLTGNGPGVLFAVFWLGAVAWNAYWWLVRITFELELDDDHLVAKGAFRTRRIPLTNVRRLRPGKMASNMVVMEIVAEPPVLTVASKGFREFADAISIRQPDIPVRLGWQARLSERLPSRSRTSMN